MPLPGTIPDSQVKSLGAHTAPELKADLPHATFFITMFSSKFESSRRSASANPPSSAAYTARGDRLQSTEEKWQQQYESLGQQFIVQQQLLDYKDEQIQRLQK